MNVVAGTVFKPHTQTRTHTPQFITHAASKIELDLESVQIWGRDAHINGKSRRFKLKTTIEGPVICNAQWTKSRATTRADACMHTLIAGKSGRSLFPKPTKEYWLSSCTQ